MGKKHYKPLYDWIINTLLDGNLISEEDIHLLSLVEDVDEVKSILTTFFEKNKIDINFD